MAKGTKAKPVSKPAPKKVQAEDFDDIETTLDAPEIEPNDDVTFIEEDEEEDTSNAFKEYGEGDDLVYAEYINDINFKNGGATITRKNGKQISVNRNYVKAFEPQKGGYLTIAQPSGTMGYLSEVDFKAKYK